MELLNVQIPSILECKYCGTNSEEVPIFFTLFKGKLDCFCLACYNTKIDVKCVLCQSPFQKDEKKWPHPKSERPLPSRELRDG